MIAMRHETTISHDVTTPATPTDLPCTCAGRGWRACGGGGRWSRLPRRVASVLCGVFLWWLLRAQPRGQAVSAASWRRRRCGQSAWNSTGRRQTPCCTLQRTSAAPARGAGQSRLPGMPSDFCRDYSRAAVKAPLTSTHSTQRERLDTARGDSISVQPVL